MTVIPDFGHTIKDVFIINKNGKKDIKNSNRKATKKGTKGKQYGN